MKRAALCWGDLKVGEVVCVGRGRTQPSNLPWQLFLCVENSRQSHYIRLVRLEDGDLTELPKENFGCRPLRECHARLYSMETPSCPTWADIRARVSQLRK